MLPSSTDRLTVSDNQHKNSTSLEQVPLPRANTTDVSIEVVAPNTQPIQQQTVTEANKQVIPVEMPRRIDKVEQDIKQGY